MEVKELMLKLPRYEDVERLKAYVTDHIESFRLDNNQFKREFETHNEIIKRYDEVISTKANSMSLTQLRIDLEKMLNNEIKDLQMVDEHIRNDLSRSIEEQQQFQEVMTNQLDEKVKNTMRKERNKAQAQEAKNNHAATAEGVAALRSLMQLKADKQDLDKVFALKMNKVDFENVLDIQSVMSKQFKHLLVLFIEIINCQVSKVNDTRISQEKKI